MADVSIFVIIIIIERTANNTEHGTVIDSAARQVYNNIISIHLLQAIDYDKSWLIKTDQTLRNKK